MSTHSTHKPLILGFIPLRILAFLIIFISHSILSCNPLGAMGVSFFIMVSGFLHSYHLGRNQAPVPTFPYTFLQKCYALHIVTFLFMLPFRIPFIFSLQTLLDEFLKGISNILLLQSFIPTPEYNFSVNGTAWFLSTYLFLIIIFPFIHNQIIHFTPSLLIYFSLVLYTAMVATSYLLKDNPLLQAIVYIHPLSRTFDFTIGCMLGILLRNYTISSVKPSPSAYWSVLEATSLLLTFFSLFISWKKCIPFYLQYTVFWVPISVMLLCVFGYSRGFFSMTLGQFSFMPFISSLTFEMFLIHSVIIRYEAFLSHRLGNFPAFSFFQTSQYYSVLRIIICFAVTLLCSFIFHKWHRRHLFKSSFQLNHLKHKTQQDS